MAYEVRLSSRALRELDRAFEWFAERSPLAAERWRVRLLDAIKSLGNNPDRHELAPESDWYPGIRQLYFGKRTGIYRVLFEIRGQVVFVLRVRHGAQSWLEPGQIQK